MNIDDALDFLRRHQRMPEDERISDELIQQYEEIRRYLKDNPDQRALPLLLGSFGPGLGHGVFQLVDEAIWPYPHDVVVRALDDVLRQDHPGLWWILQIALDFTDPKLKPHFTRLLRSSSRDERFFAAANLERLYENRDAPIVRHALAAESDNEIAALLKRMLGNSV